jgi:integrase
MAEDRLTEAFVENVTCPPGKKDRLIFDRDLPGFGLRVGQNGSKTFIVQFNVRGGKRRMAIGAFGTVTPDKARRHAKSLLGAVAAGQDPVAQRRAEAAAATAKEAADKVKAAEEAYTVRTLFSNWQDAREGDRRSSYLKLATAALNRHFPKWLDRPAASITTAEAVRELDRIKRDAGGVAANRVLSYGRAAYGWAVKRQALPSNPFAGVEAPSGEKSRDRVLAPDELGGVWRAAAGLSQPYSEFVRLLLLTLQRREEVAGMRWSELSADLMTWTIPKERSKNGRAHIVHLAPPAQAILREIPHRKGCAFVFPAASGRPITAFSAAKRQLDLKMAAERAEAGEPHATEGWTFHDFRRAGVTALAGMGFPPHVCDRLLNHVTGSIQGVAAVYQRQEFLAERKAALEAWAALVTRAAEGEAAAENVVALRVTR